MAVMSIRIDEKKRKALKIIASIKGRTMGNIVAELIDEYVKKKTENDYRKFQKKEI